MSFTYTTNIPFATHNPSVDQPVMEENTNAINQWVGIDHVPFNTAGLGQHEQVTFNSNNVPSIPTAPPVLFTNIQDGNGNNLPGSLAQLFFYSGSNLNGSTQFLSGANGSVLLLGGIVMKWGSGANTGGVGPNVSFPVAFPNACFVVMVIGTSTLYTGGFVVTSESLSGFNVSRTSGTGATGYYYLAIGN